MAEGQLVRNRLMLITRVRGLGGPHGCAHGPCMAHDALEWAGGEPGALGGVGGGGGWGGTTTTGGGKKTPTRVVVRFPWGPKVWAWGGAARPRARRPPTSPLSPLSLPMPKWQIGCKSSRPSPVGSNGL